MLRVYSTCFHRQTSTSYSLDYTVKWRNFYFCLTGNEERTLSFFSLFISDLSLGTTGGISNQPQMTTEELMI